MSYRLKRPPVIGRMIRFVCCKELMTVVMLLGIALLTWALIQDKGIFVPYRQNAVEQINQTSFYDKVDLYRKTVTLEELQ